MKNVEIVCLITAIYNKRIKFRNFNTPSGMGF